MPRKPLAIITADWHIRRQDRVWYRRETLSGDTSYGIQQVVNLAEHYRPEAVFLLGDLFDQRLQQSDALMTMRRAMKQFEFMHVEVPFVQGQHELSYPPLMCAIHGWPDHRHSETFEVGNAVAYGLDYQRPRDVESALNDVPEVDLLLTHQVWKDFMGDDRGDAWFSSATPSIIATGDYHKTVVADYGTKRVISPGPLCMQNIGEEPAKSVVLLYDDLTTAIIPLKSRGVFHCRIHTEEELQSFIDTWKDNPARVPQEMVHTSVRTNILRVWYRADIPEARPRIEGCVGSSVHLFLQVMPVEDPQITLDAERRVTAVLQGGLVGCINELYSENPAVRDDAIRLARTKDFKSELQHLYTERLKDGIDSDGKGVLPTKAPTDPRTGETANRGCEP